MSIMKKDCLGGCAYAAIQMHTAGGRYEDQGQDVDAIFYTVWTYTGAQLCPYYDGQNLFARLNNSNKCDENAKKIIVDEVKRRSFVRPKVYSNLAKREIRKHERLSEKAAEMALMALRQFDEFRGLREPMLNVTENSDNTVKLLCN